MINRIKEIRKAKNLNQAEFGARIGVKQATVSTWEKGRNPAETALLQICNTFNVRMEYLKEGKEPIFEEDEESKLARVEEVYKSLLKEISELPFEELMEADKFIRKNIQGRYPDN